MHKISVLIPCYNVADFVLKSVDSVINQTYSNLEIILIDDGSTDHTYEFLQKLAMRDKRILLVKNEVNLGLIRTLNKGILLASGKYIARFDADDLILFDRLDKQVRVMINEPWVQLVTTYADYIKPDGKYHSFVETFMGTSVLSAKFIGLFETPLLHAGMLIDTKLLRSVGYKEDEEAKYIEDYVLFMELLRSDVGLAVLTGKHTRYLYTRNEKSVSHSNKTNQNEHLMAYSKKMISEMLGLQIDDKIHRVISLRDLDLINITLVQQGIKKLKEIEKSYITKNKIMLNALEIKEINTWVYMRILKMLTLTLLNNPFRNGFSVIWLLIKNHKIFMYKRVYISIVNRLIGAFNNIKF